MAKDQWSEALMHTNKILTKSEAAIGEHLKHSSTTNRLQAANTHKKAKWVWESEWGTNETDTHRSTHLSRVKSCCLQCKLYTHLYKRNDTFKFAKAMQNDMRMYPFPLDWCTIETYIYGPLSVNMHVLYGMHACTYTHVCMHMHTLMHADMQHTFV